MLSYNEKNIICNMIPDDEILEILYSTIIIESFDDVEKELERLKKETGRAIFYVKEYIDIYLELKKNVNK